MTAWTLGPSDKANIFVRYLIERRLWRTEKTGFLKEFRDNIKKLRDTAQPAREVVTYQMLQELIRRETEIAGMADRAGQATADVMNIRVQDLQKKLTETTRFVEEVKRSSSPETLSELRPMLDQLESQARAANEDLSRQTNPVAQSASAGRLGAQSKVSVALLKSQLDVRKSDYIDAANKVKQEAATLHAAKQQADQWQKKFNTRALNSQQFSKKGK